LIFPAKAIHLIPPAECEPPAMLEVERAGEP